MGFVIIIGIILKVYGIFLFMKEVRFKLLVWYLDASNLPVLVCFKFG